MHVFATRPFRRRSDVSTSLRSSDHPGTNQPCSPCICQCRCRRNLQWSVQTPRRDSFLVCACEATLIEQGTMHSYDTTSRPSPPHSAERGASSEVLCCLSCRPEDHSLEAKPKRFLHKDVIPSIAVSILFLP